MNKQNLNTLSQILICVLVTILFLLNITHAHKPNFENEKEPWRTLSWAGLYHDLNQRDEARLKSKWEVWQEIYTYMNKSIVKYGDSWQHRISFESSGAIGFLCANWGAYIRFLDLNSRLDNHKTLDRKRFCPKLDDFIKSYKAAEVSIKLISASIQSPASAFGHLILSIELPLSNHSVLERALTFSFSVPYVSDLTHGLKLLFADEHGHYGLDSFNKVMSHYLNQEDRSIWSYPLALTQIQKERLLTEIWSLVQLSRSRIQVNKQSNGQSPDRKLLKSRLRKVLESETQTVDLRTAYSFSYANCASKIALILANATRNFKIYQDFDWPHAPQELIQNLSRIKLIHSAKFLPSISDRLRAMQSLKSNDKRIFFRSNLKEYDQSNLFQKINDELLLVKLHHSVDEARSLQIESQEEIAKKQSILLKRITNNPIKSNLSELKLDHLYALGASPDPVSSLAYAQLTLGLKTQINSNPNLPQYAQRLHLRWRGQDFADQSTPYALSQQAWTLGAFEFKHDSIPDLISPKNSSHNDDFWEGLGSRFTLFEYKQRALNEQRSWTWNMLLAYQNSPKIHLALGRTFANDIHFEHVQFESKSMPNQIWESKYILSHLDQSRLFSWINPNSISSSNQQVLSHRSSWQASFLMGINYDDRCGTRTCSSPLQLQILAHGLSNALSVRQTLLLVELESEIALGLYDGYQWLHDRNEWLKAHHSVGGNLLSQQHSLRVYIRYQGQQYLALQPYTLNFSSSYHSNLLDSKDGYRALNFNISLSFNY